MSVRIDKHVQIDDSRARRLEQLARSTGSTENALIEEALDLLFRENALTEDERDAWEELQRLEAETGTCSVPTSPPLHVETYTLTHAVYADATTGKVEEQ